MAPRGMRPGTPVQLLLLLLLLAATGCRSGVVEVERSVTAVLGQDVVLPCRYRAQEGEQVVQVTWLKRGPAGHSAEVAVLNRQHGEHVQDAYAGRVLRRAPGALEDGAIVLRNAVQGDEGDYECHLITFPMGSFEGRLTLKVLDLSDASVLGHSEEWAEGMEGATLTCLGDGNPPPTYNWTRLNASLPAGVRVKGDTLVFQRPLAAADAGDYVCRVANRVATKEARANVSVKGRAAENEVRKVDLVSASVVVVGVIAAVLLCVLVVVVVVMTLYHKRKTKRISEKYEEELTLTRENSIRRLHSSHSTDTRTQSEEAEGRSYSTLSTVREIETQTEVPAAPLLPAPEGKEPKEEEEDGGDNPIKQAMTHFVQENGMLQAKPTTNGIYINGRGHLV